jgi:hypothetical protein
VRGGVSRTSASLPRRQNNSALPKGQKFRCGSYLSSSFILKSTCSVRDDLRMPSS